MECIVALSNWIFVIPVYMNVYCGITLLMHKLMYIFDSVHLILLIVFCVAETLHYRTWNFTCHAAFNVLRSTTENLLFP